MLLVLCFPCLVDPSVLYLDFACFPPTAESFGLTSVFWDLHGPLPCRTWCNPGMNPRGTFCFNHGPPRKQTLVEPYLKPPRTTPQPLNKVVEGGGTFMEPYLPKRGTLPQTTPDHPAALHGTLVERWEPRGTWWNGGGTMAEPWWNLMSGPPRTTPEPRPSMMVQGSARGPQGSTRVPEMFCKVPWFALPSEQ